VTASLTGLRTGTTYHYRIEAANATGHQALACIMAFALFLT
jgi:hypothetical protein